ncbi:hypothetical protein VTN96DRAFT_9125 [Rasamsonia emersonii]
MCPHGVGGPSAGDPSRPKIFTHVRTRSGRSQGKRGRWRAGAQVAAAGISRRFSGAAGALARMAFGRPGLPCLGGFSRGSGWGATGPSTRHFDAAGHDLRCRRYRYRTRTPRSKPLHPPLAQPGGEPPCHDGLRFSPVPSSSRRSPSLPTHIVLTPPADLVLSIAIHRSPSPAACLPTYLPTYLTLIRIHPSSFTDSNSPSSSPSPFSCSFAAPSSLPPSPPSSLTCSPPT